MRARGLMVMYVLLFAGLAAEVSYCFSPEGVALPPRDSALSRCLRPRKAALIPPVRRARPAPYAQSARCLCAGEPPLPIGTEPGASAFGPTLPTRSGKTPLVILIGFLGCTPGIIAKYSQMYQAMGVEAVEVIPSIRSMLLAHQGWRGRGSRAVKSVCKLILQRAPDSEIIVHIFSNNGFIFFGSCMLAQEQVSVHVSGIILDSCPCYITPDVAATGLMSATRRVEASDTGKQWARNLVKTAVYPLLRVLEARQHKVWQTWSSSFPKVPHLFMYSDGDAVVPADEIRDFAGQHLSRLQALGVECDISRWETAQHCGLLREDPDKYCRDVSAFLNRHL